ncbi:FapA family protein [Bacillus tianshenii]|nr:FapA family protein [Bacillus tianshenii]
MSGSIVSKGKTVAEAINIGLDILGLTKEEVSIEILQQEKKGVLKVGSKQAIVKLTRNVVVQLKEEVEQIKSNNLTLEELIDTLEIPEENSPVQTAVLESTPSKEELESEGGIVWVKSGQIFSKNGETHFPTIQVGAEIELYRNGELVKGVTVVSEEDTFEMRIQDIEVPTKWDITFNQSKTKALLKVIPGYIKKYTIQDTAPERHITINVIESIIDRNNLEYDEILVALKELGVKHGFDHAEMLKATTTNKEEIFVVASGIEPTNGKDGWLELKVEVDDTSGPVEKQNGTVDFREIRRIPSIEKGKVVAVLHQPVPGKPGKNVLNELLPPKQAFPIICKQGKGVQVIDNTKVVSTEAGRPHLIKRGMLATVSVLPKLVHHQDLDIASGNIRFKGDVDILGNVQDGMLVEAEGNIFVAKNVNMSKLTTNNAVLVNKNVIGSTLSAGRNNMVIAELGALLNLIKTKVKQIISSIQQLETSAAFKTTDLNQGGMKPLIKILLEKKFNILPRYLNQFIHTINQGDESLDREWVQMGEKLKRCFLSTIPNEYDSREQIENLLEEIETLYQVSQTPVEPNAYISINYCLNSKIYCSGNVTIHGQGSYNSKIHSGGKLEIKGILRGGEVYGQYGVDVEESGTEVGVPTKISVPADQTIKIGTAKEGTTIKIGNVQYKFHGNAYNIKAQLDPHENKIMFK